jgi:hypothetical protein
MAKALALHSGGLDSTLAIRVIQEQGIEVEAVHFVSVFDCGATDEDNCRASRRTAAQLGVKAHFVPFSEDLFPIVKSPKHGHGRNMNPCIDCHARMMQRASEMMRALGADFLISGEVLGERPMSQRREALRIVERESGIEGLVLRPLSAKLLPPTIPEEKGWVDRERLLDISGRSRKRQLELAKQYGLTGYPTPAGGCLLTEPGFSARLRELLEDNPESDLDDVRLLKVGRHFRLAPRVKAVVGRLQKENERLMTLVVKGDYLLDAVNVPGPMTLVRGPAGDAELAQAAAIAVRYGKAASRPSCAVRVVRDGGEDRVLEASAADEALLDRLRIGDDAGRGGGPAGE